MYNVNTQSQRSVLIDGLDFSDIHQCLQLHMVKAHQQRKISSYISERNEHTVESRLSRLHYNYIIITLSVNDYRFKMQQQNQLSITESIFSVEF